MLEGLIEAFPFVIQGIHADNGSESIHHRVAALLNKLRIGAFTKSRPRHCNDNAPRSSRGQALAESKNASVVRKSIGHGHIPRRLAPVVNEFTQHVLSPFLNSHRPCLFPTHTLDAKGRVRSRYRDSDVMTPYDKLKFLDNAERFLNPGVTFDPLDAIAHAVSDLDAANALNDARDALFRTIGRVWSAAAWTLHPTRTIRRLNHVPANPPPDPTRAVDLSLAAPFPPPLRLTCPIDPASAFGFRTEQGLCRSFVPFSIPLPFTHFPTPPTTPSTSLPSGSSSYWKRPYRKVQDSPASKGDFIGARIMYSHWNILLQQ